MATRFLTILILLLLPAFAQAGSCPNCDKMRTYTQENVSGKISRAEFVLKGSRLLNAMAEDGVPVQAQEVEPMVRMAPYLLKADEDTGISDDLFYANYAEAPRAFDRVIDDPKILTPDQRELLQAVIAGARESFVKADK
jgi:hypothetical protein